MEVLYIIGVHDWILYYYISRYLVNQSVFSMDILFCQLFKTGFFIRADLFGVIEVNAVVWEGQLIFIYIMYSKIHINNKLIFTYNIYSRRYVSTIGTATYCPMVNPLFVNSIPLFTSLVARMLQNIRIGIVQMICCSMKGFKR